MTPDRTSPVNKRRDQAVLCDTEARIALPSMTTRRVERVNNGRTTSVPARYRGLPYNTLQNSARLNKAAYRPLKDRPPGDAISYHAGCSASIMPARHRVTGRSHLAHEQKKRGPGFP